MFDDRIYEACNANNHEAIKDILSSAESGDAKREIFSKIIETYEKKGIFPVGYALMFIKWLIERQDLTLAMSWITKCLKSGVSEEKISHLVYDTLIRPNEQFYRDRFENNLKLLKENRVLFSDVEFNFEKAKYGITIISDAMDELPPELSKQKDVRPFLCDITKIDMLDQVFEKNRLVHLAYDDMKKMNYLLMFKDLSKVSGFIKEKKVLFFFGEEQIKDFFLGDFIIPPTYCQNSKSIRKYKKIIEASFEVRVKEHVAVIEDLKDYYKCLDYQYYKRLFSKEPSQIKVMLVTSENFTAFNKFIVKNWHKAFLELGYQSRLLIENEPYEVMNGAYMFKFMKEYKPDILFFINQSVWTTMLNVREICKNVLYLMRYRDTTDISYTEKGYDYGNMFILPMFTEFVGGLRYAGIPDDRIYYTADGVDLDIFTNKGVRDERYECDIVAVNNAGGSEMFQFEFLIGQFEDKELIRIIHELYYMICDMANNDNFIFFKNSFQKIVEQKLMEDGFKIDSKVMTAICDGLEKIMVTLYRRKVVEWIIDSKITKNIKLWGQGWANIDKCRPFAMGIAKYGEELSAIYRNSKISLSDHQNIPLHERNFEILASGGFPLVKNIEPENGEYIDRITNYFRENEDIVLFYNKDDLLNKIEYYLSHPQERQTIADNGRQVVIDNFTHVAIAKKTMDFIKSYYTGGKQKV